MHVSPTDIADDNKMVYPNESGSNTEWQCVAYTDNVGVMVETEADDGTVTEELVFANSRCEYKMNMSFMDDAEN